jgi:hypothetical protein
MRRLLICAVASFALAVALAAPVAADPASYPGCSDFGAASATGGHKEIPGLEGVPFGQVLQLFFHTGPGAISTIVADEHSTMCTHP